MTEVKTQAQKQEFIGGLIAAEFAKAGAKKIIEVALNRVAKSKNTDMSATDVKPATEIVSKDLKADMQAKLEHQLDAEPHIQSRNLWGVLFGLMGEAAILYTYATDNVAQDFQTQWAPHIMVILGLLTPLYSRFVAKKPLFR